jgi:hypothetical protein
MVMVREQLHELCGKSKGKRKKGMLLKKKNRGICKLERKKDVK